jgi:hypothetical protein
MLEALLAPEDSPYRGWDGFTQNRLTRQLKKYGVPTDHILHDVGGKSVRGWLRSHFEDAWERHLPPTGDEKRAKCANGSVEPILGVLEVCGNEHLHELKSSGNPHDSSVRTLCTLSTSKCGAVGERQGVNATTAPGDSGNGLPNLGDQPAFLHYINRLRGSGELDSEQWRKLRNQHKEVCAAVQVRDAAEQTRAEQAA